MGDDTGIIQPKQIVQGRQSDTIGKFKKKKLHLQDDAAYHGVPQHQRQVFGLWHV